MSKKTEMQVFGFSFGCQNPDREAEPESILILKAFLLDTQIENPRGVVIAHGEATCFLDEVLAEQPELLPKMIEERARVYGLLGWEVLDDC